MNYIAMIQNRRSVRAFRSIRHIFFCQCCFCAALMRFFRVGISHTTDLKQKAQAQQNDHQYFHKFSPLEPQIKPIV